MNPSLHYEVAIDREALRFDFVSMTPSIHYELEVSRKQSVRVALTKAARIYLVDDTNYERLRAHERFKYLGRSKDRNTVVIRPNHPGKWHVVISGEVTEDMGASVSLVS